MHAVRCGENPEACVSDCLSRMAGKGHWVVVVSSHLKVLTMCCRVHASAVLMSRNSFPQQTGLFPGPAHLQFLHIVPPRQISKRRRPDILYAVRPQGYHRDRVCDCCLSWAISTTSTSLSLALCPAGHATHASTMHARPGTWYHLPFLVCTSTGMPADS